MTPVPLELPLRPNEAAELAALIFDVAERKPLTDEVRNRIAGRAAGLRLESIQPFFGSLDRDPVHHATYYVAVDTNDGGHYLLHMGPATAPTSSLFSKPLLIGRMPQFVINTVPFGPGDADAVDKFAGQIDKAFLPRPHGAQRAIVAPAGGEAFEAFRGVLRRTGRNVAAVRGDYHAAVWSAIRAGWRHGYSAVVDLPSDCPREAVRAAAQHSTFVVGLQSRDELEACEQVHTYVREARSVARIQRPWDFAVSLERSAVATTAEELDWVLETLKTHQRGVQIVFPNLAGVGEEKVRELVEVCGRFQCSLGARREREKVERATGGRTTFWVATAEDVGE